MNPIAEDILMHYGVKRRSGRYPWGSGDNPYQHSGDFLSRVQELKKQGLSEKDIVEAMGLDSTTQLRVAYKVAKNERRRLDVDRAKSLQQDGLSPTEIGKKMGVNESTVRSWLNEDSEKRMNSGTKTAEVLKEELKNKKILDVGVGVERELGVTRNTLEEALFMLEAEGYTRTGIGARQPNSPGKQTTMMVICDSEFSKQFETEKALQSYLYRNMNEIQSVGEYHSTDGGQRWDKREYPASIDSSRIQVRYGDQGGSAKDGVIELRPGVQDLDLGKSHYAQVRILVDGTHYLKGMAMYSDDLPEGVDIMFNTNKKSDTPKMDTFKKISKDPENPFGAYIKADGQSWYDAPDGTKKLSAINKLKEEGDWDTMSRNLSSQFLSKQPMSLIKKQLDLTYKDYAAEYDEICSLTNPTIKKQQLLEFANKCDSATVHLKAAALPRQETRVILPLTQLKETEVYAPYLNNGEKVCLVRYPHGGIFEIPELTVNNKNPSAKKILGNATDAIGINSKVAEQLSGADFDGDTVIVIPVNNKVKVQTKPYHKELKDFDSKSYKVDTVVEDDDGNKLYGIRNGQKVKLMTESQKQRQMGEVSNLITDMTLRGADEKEIIRAVKHSMVVIDAPKHSLDYKQSEKDNGIAELKRLYQPKYDDDGNVIGGGGASTLISKKKQTVDVPERRGSGRIDPETGNVIYKESGRTYINKDGKEVSATTKVKLLNYTEDVRTLSSGTLEENAYADYANKMKALANQARIESTNTGKLVYSNSAKQTYQTEVESLNAKLRLAQLDAPKQRRALAIANSVIEAKKQEYPYLKEKAYKKDLEKIQRMALEDAKASVGASRSKSSIVISDKEWEAIQAGAISDSKLTDILRYTDKDALRERAMPRTTTQLSTAKASKASAMKASGYTTAEIAEALGVSTSTVSRYFNS